MAIEKMSLEQTVQKEKPLRKIAITDSELNSYIAYRIESEKQEIMKELRLKLFKKNKIEGKILINLKGQDIPKILRPQMTFYIGGKFEVKNGKIRFDIKDIFFEEQRVQIVFIDLIIYIASIRDNKEPWSIEDWFELPYGIKDIETHPGKAVFYY